MKTLISFVNHATYQFLFSDPRGPDVEMAFFGQTWPDLGPKRATSIEISDYYSATANLNLQKRRVQSVRMRKFRNFVPWQVHRQVLVLSALGTIHIIRNHFWGIGGFIKNYLAYIIKGGGGQTFCLLLKVA